jgi:hypothetical protein
MNTTEINETFQLRGHTRIWKNDELIFDKHNAIVSGNGGVGTPNGLKEYLADVMAIGGVVGGTGTVAVMDRAIDDRFAHSNTLAGAASLSGTNYNLLALNPPVAGFVAKDGIIISTFDTVNASYGTNTAFAMITTVLTNTQTFGKKWRGVFTATGAVSASNAVLGHSLKSDTRFDTLDDIGGNVQLEKLFITAYAKQAFQGVTLAAADTLTIEWEVYIA